MKFQQNYLSSIHHLRLIPTFGLLHFAADQTQVHQLSGAEPVDANATPGSITTTVDDVDGFQAKTLRYMRRINAPADLDELNIWRETELLVAYVDEAGITRLMGTPSYPCRLKYTNTGGRATVTITCTDTEGDRIINPDAGVTI